jgi:hypothetical protein
MRTRFSVTRAARRMFGVTLQSCGLLILTAVSGSSPAQAQLVANTWTGATSDGKWETGGNWSAGVAPAPNHDVVIPGNSGWITTTRVLKRVNSLILANSDPSNPPSTIILGNEAGAGVQITAEKDISVGTGNTVRGMDGGVGSLHGGSVTLTSTTGNVTLANSAYLRGGEGAGGQQGGDGGSVTVTGDAVRNDGRETGGGGGPSTSANSAGGRGGSVTNKGRDAAMGGTNEGGSGGAGTATNGAGGSAVTQAPRQIVLAQNDRQTGEAIELLGAPGGEISLRNMVPGQILAGRLVCIDGGDMETPIDLRGNAAGSTVIAAPGGEIHIRGQVLLDPGVSLASITEPDAVVSNDACSTAVPMSTRAVAGLLAGLLLVAGSVILARRRDAALDGAGHPR